MAEHGDGWLRREGKGEAKSGRKLAKGDGWLCRDMGGYVRETGG